LLKTFGDLEEDRKIDKGRLDEENAIQPMRYGFYADQYAQAKTELERAKNNLEATIAKQSLFYRRNPPTDLKTTEAVFDALINADREVCDAKEAVTVSQEAVNTLYAAVSSIQDVRSSIDNLVKLSVNKFYGEQDRDITREKLNRN